MGQYTEFQRPPNYLRHLNQYGFVDFNEDFEFGDTIIINVYPYENCNIMRKSKMNFGYSPTYELYADPSTIQHNSVYIKIPIRLPYRTKLADPLRFIDGPNERAERSLVISSVEMSVGDNFENTVDFAVVDSNVKIYNVRWFSTRTVNKHTCGYRAFEANQV
ncbi:unnamed protein product [Caenorhabditis bovis]|uniref:Uncharacterized protein n=1 Tax=Caenorhabditis bovis TaxID=2654633 RepID=A0A8S1EC27_9PELO|nr:unnamed protein product [Caenorhabditis bovis]